MQFQHLSLSQYQTLRTQSEVVEADAFGDKVLRKADGSYLKLFRRKRLLSSATLKPYSRRFADNAARLQALGIPTVQVLALYRIPELQRTAVHYAPLAGDTLRHLIYQLPEAERATLARQLASFIEELHQKGVYFRSLHLGNVVRTPEGTLGLIDIADMKFYRRPLSSKLRQRNRKHLARYPNDLALLPTLGC